MPVRPLSLKSFREYLSEGRIMASRCSSCGKIHLPPRPICSNCKKMVNEWMELKGEGIIKAFTVIHVPLSKMKNQSPYVIGIIDFDEGGSISGIIMNMHETDRDLIGLRVKGQIVKEDGEARLCFHIVS